ncbi:MAG TPA: sulfatase [Tepidisphaeraceae bacterium]
MKIVAAVLFSSIFLIAVHVEAAESKPNIIVILADDLGHADVGAQGRAKDVKTPNIDTIAHNGVRFTNAYVSCPVCSPTRAGLLTGRYQQRFGHEMNPGPTPPENFGLPLDQVTLPQVLKERGYATGLVGKWHEGQMPAYHPNKRGFDEFFGFLGGAHSYTKSGSGRNMVMRNSEPADEKEYLTDAFSREAVSFIEKHREGPFFLYLAYNAIHTPQEVAEKYAARFPDEKDPKRRNMLAMLSAEDDGVGRVLETLRKNKLEEKTLVFFFSDNGGPTQGNGSRNTPFSGYKGEVWEGGIRVPFFVQWKDHIKAGQVLDQTVIQLDIFPTAAKVAGAAAPTDRKMDGADLMPLMTGKDEKAVHEDLYWRIGSQSAMRSGNYKLIRFKGLKDQLYNLADDPGEKKNLAEKEPEKLTELAGKYDAWDAQMKAPLWQGKEKFQETQSGTVNQEPLKGGRGRRGAKGGRQESQGSPEEG